MLIKTCEDGTCTCIYHFDVFVLFAEVDSHAFFYDMILCIIYLIIYMYYN